ncbi:MAG TPA: hypothetical protein VFA11_11780 [Acidimicrobiales bacterium]|nr:hypothetical protein [Acidimicrobiales bacterium]
MGSAGIGRRAVAAACVAALAGWLGLSPAARAGGVATVHSAAQGGAIAGAGVPLSPGTDAPDSAALAKLRGDGLNTVSFFVWWEADGPQADSVHSFTGTEPDAVLSAEIAAAEAAGMRVVLTPVFVCTGCEGDFRGVIHPANLDAFFASYRAFMDHYAALAQADGVSVLFVGSEMSSLENDGPHWRQVVGDARAHFGGTIAYEENWDELGHAAFLDAVDLVGVSAYFPLDDRPAPTLGQLLGDWQTSSAAATRGRHWVASVAALAAATHKPIVFAEAGYMSGQYAARAPYLNFYGITDWQLQADLYQALLETFSGQPWWHGVIWWDWENTDGPALNGRPFHAKTAEAFLQLWYGLGARPSTASQPLLPAVGS